MSRIGKTPIDIGDSVTVTVDGGTVVVKGLKGELTFALPKGVTVSLTEKKLIVESKGRSREASSLHGFVRAKLANDIEGVSRGWSKTLELSGVGYRATVNGTDLVLTLGFSHPVTVHPPPGITIQAGEGKITVSGVDKHLVGQVAASIRSIKKPEPYKGKGIRYAGEHIRKKAGKAAKAIGGAPAGGGK